MGTPFTTGKPCQSTRLSLTQDSRNFPAVGNQSVRYWYRATYGVCLQLIFIIIIDALQWRHNEHDGVSNHQPHECLRNPSFMRRSKKTSKLRITDHCEGNSPVTGEFPAQRASNAENVSIWLRHHGKWLARRLAPSLIFINPSSCTLELLRQWEC